MKKGTWSNLFGTVLAGATLTTVYMVSKKMTKKYGQKIKTDKLFDINVGSIVNAAVDTFLDTDNDKIEQFAALFEKEEQ
ncbi:MAG: hypothetical protein Q3968_01435 [Clostridiaceae bacterium]|jgi:hypothetical protein|nr:hypothetical protein [Clostridiaceae bacterium]